VFLPGFKALFVELKRPRGGRLSPQQVDIKKTLDFYKHPVLVIRNQQELDEWTALISALISPGR
jgi:hypothetical protein